MLPPLKIFRISLKLIKPSPDGTEVSRALYILLILSESGFAHLPKIDAKFDKKVQKSGKIEKNPEKLKSLKLNRADQKLFFWH